MKHFYLLRSFLFILLNIFILLLLELEVFELYKKNSSPFFLFIVALILIFWILSINSFFQFSSLINKEKLAREADRLQLEESQKLIQTLRSQRHDFKNQLQVIRVMAQFERNNEIVDYIQDCNASLDFSKEIPIQIDNAVISAMTIFFATQARENGIDFSVDLDLDFTNFNLSPAKITRILGNIIRNAIEIFQSDSKKERNIQLTMWEKEETYHFLIWNNGPPISEDKQKIIFQAGYSSKNSTGLGLTIVKQLVDEMGGRISLKSNDEEGTEFKIIIPKRTPEPKLNIDGQSFSETTIKADKV